MFRNLLSHIFSVLSVHRETDTGSRGIPNMCETKVGLRNKLSFFLPTESISSDLIFRVRASD